MTSENLVSPLTRAGVKYCLIHYVNIHGSSLGKIAPIELLPSILSGTGVYFAGIPDDGVGQNPNEIEISGAADAESIMILPWDSQLCWVPVSLIRNGEPHAECSRNTLQRTVLRGDRLHHKINVGIELECYLVRQNPDHTITPSTTNEPLIPAYNIQSMFEIESFWSRVIEYCISLGWSVPTVTHEGGRSQVEFSLKYDTPIKAADGYFLFKLLLRHAAQECGMIVTFMPKPFESELGSSAQLNFSLIERPNSERRSLLTRYQIDMTDSHYHFVAGLLEHSKGLSAVCCPTVNSYKRLASRLSPTTWAPFFIAYGPDNRTALVRLVPRDGRIEFRLPDPSCNMYLALAAAISAGLDGIETARDPGPPTTDNLACPNAATSQDELSLPQNLLDAVREFRKDNLFEAVFSKVLHSEFIRIKEAEWGEYERTVTAWEINRYLHM